MKTGALVPESGGQRAMLPQPLVTRVMGFEPERGRAGLGSSVPKNRCGDQEALWSYQVDSGLLADFPFAGVSL